ncbi:hypothetical protein [Paraburkholderia sp. EG304]|uniref:hypothetical protein n=1 Tax=Paraburkholderia sp. EG304 TaxID=3237015 RepID=UPI003979781D
MARFCEINGISAKRAADFLYKKRAIARRSEDGVIQIAAVLNEDPHLVDTSLRPLTNAPLFDVRFRGADNTIRFCPVCARSGYQSNFHLLTCLNRCPFHGCELEKHTIVLGGGVKFIERTVAVGNLVRERCDGWPAFGKDYSIAVTDDATKILDWLVSASRAATELRRRQVWKSVIAGEDVDDDRDLFGKLRRMVPPGKRLEPFFLDRWDLWDFERCDFGIDVKDSIDALYPSIGFAGAYAFFKHLGDYKASGVGFLPNLKRARDELIGRHGSCGCHWAFVDRGWNSVWRRVSDPELVRKTEMCPFAFALSEIDEEWGVASSFRSRRRLLQDEILMTRLSRVMRDNDLIRYTRDAELSPEGDLYFSPSPLSFCEWNSESPLSRLFNIAAQWEIELMSDALNGWLDEIERGEHPAERYRPQKSIELIEADRGVSLIRWMRTI